MKPKAASILGAIVVIMTLVIVAGMTFWSVRDSVQAEQHTKDHRVVKCSRYQEITGQPTKYVDGSCWVTENGTTRKLEFTEMP